MIAKSNIFFNEKFIFEKSRKSEVKRWIFSKKSTFWTFLDGKFCIEYDDLAECRFFGFREVISNVKTKRTQPIGLPGGPGLTSRGDTSEAFGIEHKLMWGSKSGWVYDFENFMVYGLDLVKTPADKIQPPELKLSEKVGNAPCDRKTPLLPSKTRIICWFQTI